jgi:hypothetical protein
MHVIRMSHQIRQGVVHTPCLMWKHVACALDLVWGESIRQMCANISMRHHHVHCSVHLTCTILFMFIAHLSCVCEWAPPWSCFLQVMHLSIPIEVPRKVGSKKRAIGKKANVGHIHKEVSPNHFIKVIFEPTMRMLSIPKAFRPYFGHVPSKILVKSCTGHRLPDRDVD